jgi:hypothetical protein
LFDEAGVDFGEIFDGVALCGDAFSGGDRNGGDPRLARAFVGLELERV